MSEQGWRVRSVYDIGWDLHRIYVTHEAWDGRRSFVAPMVLAEKDAASPILPWTGEAEGIGGGEALLQAFLDAAWELGLRPKGFRDHTNELTAVRYHLEDMRTLAKVSK